MKITKFPIDLSMLTEEEIDQFRQDPSTLFEGDTDVCLYLRFSSEHIGAEFLFKERDLTPRIVVACFITFVVDMSIS